MKEMDRQVAVVRDNTEALCYQWGWEEGIIGWAGVPGVLNKNKSDI